MGADIWMFVEHKDLDTNKWNLIKNTDWRNNMVPIYRNTGLFHICVDIIIRMVSMNFQ